MRVLIAEDERRLAEAAARGPRREGMAVNLAPDGTDALVAPSLSFATNVRLLAAGSPVPAI